MQGFMSKFSQLRLDEKCVLLITSLTFKGARSQQNRRSALEFIYMLLVGIFYVIYDVCFVIFFVIPGSAENFCWVEEV